MTGKGTAPSAYRPELDWLRFCAFFAVFLHHAAPQTVSWYERYVPGSVAAWFMGAVRAGAFGVDLFLALSSFLITDLLLREERAFSRIDVPAFYLRRALRIWPLYFAFLFLCWKVFSPKLEGTALLCMALFVGNWHSMFHGFPVGPATPLWSVSIEEQFYLAWPLLLGWVGVRRLLPLVACLVGIGLGARVLLTGAPHPAVWCSTFTHLDSIGCGIAIAALQDRLPKLSPPARAALVFSGMLGLVVCGRLDVFAGPRAVVGYLIAALSCTLLLVGFLRTNAGSAPEAWPLTALAYLGKISYGLYVFHLLGILIANRVAYRTVDNLVLGFGLTVLMAVLSYHLFEAPFLRLKRRFTRIQSRPS